METKKISAKTKLSFACTDLFGGGSYNLMNFLYPAYAAIALGLGAGLAGTIMLVARIWDAVTDPIMGQISDRTKSRFGKRRFWILMGAPVILIGTVLTFFPWSMSSTAAKFLIALLCYMLFYTAQSMVMIPYYSLSSEISSDYTERAKVNTVRLAFSIFSSILCVALPNIIVNMVNNSTGTNNGYIVMSVIFGLFFSLPMLFTVFFAKEEIVTPPETKKFEVKDFVQPLKNRAFRKYLGMQICNGLTMAVMSGLFFFFVNYVIKSSYTATHDGNGPLLSTLSAGLMFITQIFALPVYLQMIKKKDKRFAYVSGALLWILIALSLLFIPPNMPDGMDWLVYLLAAVIGFGVSGPALVPHTMVGDINDACEVQFGKRKEGSVSGIMNFINNLSQAAGIAIVMWALEIFGFAKPVEGGSAVLTQPDSAQLALKLFMAFAPLVIMTVGIFISISYRIDKTKQAEIVEFLQKQRETEDFDSLSGEREALLKTL